MKKIISLLAFSIFMLSSVFMTLATTNEDFSFKLLSEFVYNANISEMEILNSSGDVIDNSISNTIKKHLLSQEFDKATKLMNNNGLNLSYVNEIKIPAKSFDPYDLSTDIYTSKNFYHCQADTTGKMTKEWITTLTIAYRENSDGTLIPLRDPTVTAETHFGAGFGVNTTSFSAGTKSTNNNRYLEFYGGYNLDATLTIPVTVDGIEFPIGQDFDWGRINVSYKIK